MIAALNKMVHYKSPEVQTYAISVLGSTLTLLREQMNDPEVLL
jgi:hypothetical protein